MVADPETVSLTPAPGFRVAADILRGREPALVYLHGLSSLRVGTKSDALLRRAQRLGLGYARFDFRGHGESAGDIGELTMTELVEDGLCVLREMGPAILVGSSLGGLVAAWVTARCPELVRGLVLLSPALGFLAFIAGHAGRDELPLTTSDGSELVISRRAIEDAARWNEAELAAQISVPTLVVHGKLDDTVPYQLSQQLHDRIPHDDKSLWLIEDGDHRLSDPVEAIYDRMEEFLLANRRRP